MGQTRGCIYQHILSAIPFPSSIMQDINVMLFEHVQKIGDSDR